MTQDRAIWFVGGSMDPPVPEMTSFIRKPERSLAGDIAWGFLHTGVADPAVERAYSQLDPSKTIPRGPSVVVQRCTTGDGERTRPIVGNW